MPDSHSTLRFFFRLPPEAVEALDALLPELRQETMGEVRDRSKAARYLLLEALRERQRRSARGSLIDEALQELESPESSVAGENRHAAAS